MQRESRINRPVGLPSRIQEAQPNEAGVYEDSAQDPAVKALEGEVEAYVTQRYPSPTTADWEAGYRKVMRAGWLDQNKQRALAYAQRKVNTTDRSFVERMLVQELEVGE